MRALLYFIDRIGHPEAQMLQPVVQTLCLCLLCLQVLLSLRIYLRQLILFLSQFEKLVAGLSQLVL